ncbi:unnamed protein product [Orchesella dallaii]|uniref:Uncharacterized protein n=1 Tax=Orchesella dallaii TaxID=48710 RepID=A0ABP1S2R4_9HEXA
MIRFNLALTVAFCLLGLAAAFPQLRYVRMTGVNGGKDQPGVDASTTASESPPTQLTPQSSLDAQQLKQSAILGGPVRFIPGITKMKTNPESPYSNLNPSKPKKEIFIDLPENVPPKQGFPTPTFVDQADEDTRLESDGWQTGEGSQAAALTNSPTGSNSQIGNENVQSGPPISSSGNGWENERESSEGVDPYNFSAESDWEYINKNSQAAAGRADAPLSTDGSPAENSKTDLSSISSSVSSTKNQQINKQTADAADAQQGEKYNDSQAPKEAESKASTQQYNDRAYDEDDFVMPDDDRRPPVLVPASEMSAYLKALSARPGNYRFPTASAPANSVVPLPYEFEGSSSAQFLQRISNQQSELKELLIQIMYRQTSLRDDIHRIDQQLTHIQQGVGITRMPYNMHRFVPYQMG